MTITVSSKLTPTLYTPISEKESKTPTKFKLRPLDGIQHLGVMMHLQVGDEGNATLSHTGLMLAIKHGLIGSVGLKDELDNEINVNAKDLEWDLLLELAGEIVKLSTITEEERKNSS